MTHPVNHATRTPRSALRVLVVDDERPAVDELAYLLDRDPRIGEVLTSVSATEALQLLQDTDVDAVFLDIQMPGLNGLELAGVLARFRSAPALVFVTAHDEHAVAAFDLRAVDYVLKPVRADRLGDTVTRLVNQGEPEAALAEVHVPVELGGVTRFVRRSDITFVEAHGDYARLHTATDTHLVRIPLTQLEQDWASAQFARIHRSLLVNLAHVTELRTEAGRCSVIVRGGEELGVSRRHTRALKDLLAQRVDTPGLR